MPEFRNIDEYTEDERIRKIGESVINTRMIIGFVTDADPGKADRYVAKLKARFPGIRVLYQGPGPVADTVLVKLAPPQTVQ